MLRSQLTLPTFAGNAKSSLSRIHSLREKAPPRTQADPSKHTVTGSGDLSYYEWPVPHPSTPCIPIVIPRDKGAILPLVASHLILLEALIFNRIGNRRR